MNHLVGPPPSDVTFGAFPFAAPSTQFPALTKQPHHPHDPHRPQPPTSVLDTLYDDENEQVDRSYCIWSSDFDYWLTRRVRHARRVFELVLEALPASVSESLVRLILKWLTVDPVKGFLAPPDPCGPAACNFVDDMCTRCLRLAYWTYRPLPLPATSYAPASFDWRYVKGRKCRHNNTLWRKSDCLFCYGVTKQFPSDDV